MNESGAKPPLIAVMGTFGESNTGDDVLMMSVLNGVRARRPEARFVVYTCDRDHTARLLAGEGFPAEACDIVYTGRHGLREPGRPLLRSLGWIPRTLRTIAAADLLLIGPGTQLQDVTRRFRLLFFLSRAFMAWALRTPFAFIGMGCWRVEGRICRAALRFTGNRAVFLATRDAGSARDLAALGIREDVLRPLADISFAEIPPPGTRLDGNPVAPAAAASEVTDPEWNSSAVSSRKRSPGETSGTFADFPETAESELSSDGMAFLTPGAEGVPPPLIGLTLRCFPKENFPEEHVRAFRHSLAALLPRIASETGARFVFLPFYDGRGFPDTQALEELRTLIDDPAFPVEIRRWSNLSELRALIAGCDALIGMRLHSILLAVQAAVPVLAISYAEKAWRFMIENGLADCAVRIEADEAGRLREIWERLWADRDRLRSELMRIRERQRVLACGHIELALAALRPPGRLSAEPTPPGLTGA